MPPIFCFIDDSAFELDVFANHVAPAAPGIETILGSTYDEVRARLGDRYPCLFLLDLYGRDPGLPDRGISEKGILLAKTAGLGNLDDVYDGLDDFPGDRTNEFLKRLFGKADGWRRMFRQAARDAGQSNRYGLDNLEAARRDFPAAAKAPYTRKSMIMDAVDAVAAGIDGFSMKPHGPTDEAIRRATEEQAPGLIAGWNGLVTHCFNRYIRDLALLISRSGLSDDVHLVGQPQRLSRDARNLLGPAEMRFLEAAAEWWDFIGLPPFI